jgi:hypothetical protein
MFSVRVLRNDKDRCAMKLRDRKHTVDIGVYLKVCGGGGMGDIYVGEKGGGRGLKMGTVATAKWKNNDKLTGGSGTRPREQCSRRSRATLIRSHQWPSHPTAGRSCRAQAIGRCGSGTRPREQCSRRSRATLSRSHQWPSHPTMRLEIGIKGVMMDGGREHLYGCRP